MLVLVAEPDGNVKSVSGVATSGVLPTLTVTVVVLQLSGLRRSQIV